MKASRMMVCIVLLVVMMAAIAFVPASETARIETSKVPQGVGNAVVPAAAAPESGTDDREYPVAVTADVSAVGILSVNIDTESTRRMKVKVSKDDETLYYEVDSDHHLDIPLQMGDGAYTVKVFRNVESSNYEAVFAEEFRFAAENKNDVFLASNEIVNYAASQRISGLTGKVIADASNDYETVERIADYVINEFGYDIEKASMLTSDYVPDIDAVLLDQSGICYDFAAVTASMLRKAGIPAKLVMGYRSDSELYHAWNEALVDGEWVIVDTTWDNAKHNHHMSAQNPELYSAEKVF